MGLEQGGDYWAALQLDEELAAQRKDAPKTSRPPLRGYDRLVSTLMDVIDVTIRANAADPAAFTGIPRPYTGIDALAVRERNNRMADIVAKATPKEV